MRKPIAGERVYIRDIKEFSREHAKCPCKVVSSILGVAFVRPYRWPKTREDIEVPIEQLDYVDEETLSVEDRREIVSRLVKQETLDKGFAEFNMQLGYLKSLVQSYPDLAFWKNWDPGYKVAGLLWYRGGGKPEFIKQYNLYTLDITNAGRQDTTILSEKLGTDAVITKIKLDYRDL